MNQLWVVIFLSAATLLFGQEDSNRLITGKVTDTEHNEPLVGANVMIRGTSFGASTDEEGRFQLDVTHLHPGSYKLGVSYVGYHDHYTDLSIPTNGKNEYNFRLKESALTLDQIVVTGTRSERMLKHAPVTTQVIKEETIAESGAANLAEVLQRVTGVTVESNALGTGTSTVELQGFGSNHVLVMVDGMKMIGRVRGDLDISQIPSGQIERIEIVKGATSTLYGSEAMGGVINIITKKPKEHLQVNTSTQIGNYGKINTNVDLGGTINGWMQKANFSYRRSSGFDLDKSTPVWNGTAFNKYNGSFMLKKDITAKTSFQANVNYFQEDQRAVADHDFETVVDNKYVSAKIGFENRYNDNLKTTLGIEYSNSYHDQDRKVRRSGFIVNEKPTIEKLYKGEVLFDWTPDYSNTALSHKINGGYSFESESIETERVFGSGEKTNSLHNIFIQDEMRIDMFTFSPGIRVDKHSVYGTYYSPKLSAMLSPAYNIRIRASYGHGFRAPSFKELYWDYFSSIGYQIEGNPKLQPEDSESLNLGAEFWTENNYHTRINLFYNRIMNLIDFRFIEFNNGVSRYTLANISGARTWGAEWDMEYYPNDWFETGLGYYYLDSKNDINDQPLQLKPKHRTNLRFGFKFFNDFKLTTTIQTSSRKFYYSADDPEETHKNWLEAYSLFHADLSVPIISQINMNIGIKNITDYVNLEWGPMPGREYYVTFNTKF